MPLLNAKRFLTQLGGGAVHRVLRLRRFARVVASALIALPTLLAASSDSSSPIVIQLRWQHQFQFAGYYAALEKGYFAAEGLHVELRPLGPGSRVIEDLLRGKFDYAVGDGSIVLARQNGARIVIVVPIFQSSPLALITREQDHIDVPAQVKGKRLMVGTLADSAPIQAMLHDAGLKNSDFTLLPHSQRLEDLFEGKADAISGYVTSAPFWFRQRHLSVKVLWPVNYGIDFYGDLLYTSQAEAKRNPARAFAMRRAVIRGWQYALDHPDELIQLIQARYNPSLSTDQLRFEADETRKLIRAEYVEIGHLSTSRLRRMAEIFVNEGLAPASSSIEGITLDEYSKPDRGARRWLVGLAGAMLIAGLGLVGLALLNRGLRAMVARKTAELEAANEALQRDNEARRQAEEGLRREQQLTERVVDAIPGIFFVINHKRQYVRWNKEQEALIGVPADGVRQVDPLSRIHPEDRERVAQAMEKTFESGAAEVEARGFVGEGPETRHFILTARRFDDDGEAYLIGFGMDVTARLEAELARKQLEEQLRQAQKLESVGRLAGGIAHDFNNLLTVINGYSKVVLGEMKVDDPRRGPLQEIEKAGERAAGLTGQLLAFSRKQILQPGRLDLNVLVEGTRGMLERLMGEDVEVHFALHPGAVVVHADQHQFEQVIVNLAVNARDAMPSGGRVLIETALVERDESYAQSHLEVRPGRYAMIAVSDTGTGMDESTRQRIFEPFFTTKPAGQGTGLGLAMVQGIVAQSGGHISLYSEPGQGTVFKIYLPALPGEATQPEKPLPVATLQGSETILIVEDQDEVRRFAVQVLTSYGYRVIEAADADQALRICEEKRQRIQLLLTDVVMPHMSGPELAAKLMALDPEIKVLYMSGYTDNVILHHVTLDEGASFVQKPFSPQELAGRIRTILGPPVLSARIVVADDEAAVRSFFRDVLEQAGYEVREVTNGEQALHYVRSNQVQLVITDLIMPEQEGIETIRALRREFPDIRIIAVSGAFGGQYLSAAKALGADAVLSKPVGPEVLLAAVETALGL